MIQQKENWFWFKLNGLLRWGMVHRILPPYDNIILTEYPKSGGTWIGQMIAEALNIPFPRNRLPMLKRQLLHGHYKLTWNVKKPIVVFRDGRDVVVSQYFHYLIPNEKNKSIVKRHRQNFKVNNYEDIKNNLPKFIEYVNDTRYHHFTWSEFVDGWLKKDDAVFTSYENFKNKPIEELIRICDVFDVKLSKDKAEKIVDKFSFKKLAGREEGKENKNSFLRKGIVGDWKNYFNEESKQIFKKYAGNELIKLNYEKDLNW